MVVPTVINPNDSVKNNALFGKSTFKSANTKINSPKIPAASANFCFLEISGVSGFAIDIL